MTISLRGVGAGLDGGEGNLRVCSHLTVCNPSGIKLEAVEGEEEEKEEEEEEEEKKERKKGTHCSAPKM
jgi:hypothetical protein